MKAILVLLAVFYLSACTLDDEMRVPCSFDTKKYLIFNKEVDVIQNGFKIGTIAGFSHAAGSARLDGIMCLPKGKCYSLNAKFELYKPDKTRREYVVLAHNIQGKGRCLTTHDTVEIKDFIPVSLPVDSVSVRLIDSIITRLVK